MSTDCSLIFLKMIKLTDFLITMVEFSFRVILRRIGEKMKVVSKINSTLRAQRAPGALLKHALEPHFIGARVTFWSI